MEYTTYEQNQWVQHIRMRPGMYIGSLQKEGLISMLENLFEELLRYATIDPVFDLDFYPDNRIVLEVKNIRASSLASYLSSLDKQFEIYQLGTRTIISLSEKIRVTAGDLLLSATEGNYETTTSRVKAEHTANLDFTLDHSIFKELKIRYDVLIPFLQQFAYLNPSLKLTVADHKGESLQRNIFHYPRGVFEQLESGMRSDYYHAGLPRLEIEARMGNYYYQIGIFNNYWLDGALTKTFAGNMELYYGGSLEKGVFSGISVATKRLAKKKNITISMDRKTMEKYFTFLAVVKGEDFSFEGSTRRKLGMPQVQSDVREIVCEHLLELYEREPDKAEQVLTQFTIWNDDQMVL
jgi:DNA gyrase/topoisomerase IV subunit B